MRRIFTFFLALALTVSSFAQSPQITSSLVSGLKMRNIGPAFASGRIADIAIDPQNENIWYIAVGSGGVWKTTNNGITWTPIFDKQKSYSIGCVTIDPNNPHVIWVGTGENVGGRHVGYGDGIYRSTDDGQTWECMGLKHSEHISKIIVNPKNSNIIYVAAQGPLWSPGGDRGFFLSTDGGKTWQKTLGDDQWTGVTDIAIDPRNPDIVYAATWQHARTVGAYMGGGPKSGIYKSIDGGRTWKKLTVGLPQGPMGKIALAVSPENPDVVYAAVELPMRKGAFYRSTNQGESWTKMSDIISGGTGPHYYQEIYVDPHRFDRIYFADVRMKVTDDGGKTWRTINFKGKHSDNHAVAFKKSDPNFIAVGTDGGLYYSYDNGQNWYHVSDLPVTQFYNIAVDDQVPFYMIYGGTQDNSTLAGPSATNRTDGITDADWEVILFADGYHTATIPGNPDIVLAEWQEGNLVRIDRKTGEITLIKPQPRKGEPYERYNWNAPLLVSPHNPHTIFYASQRVWRSDDLGDSWTPISPDLTNYSNRLEDPIMGKKQSYNSFWDFLAMSVYHTITAIDQSPVNADILWAGTDDGYVAYTANSGKNWTRIPVEKLGAPAGTFVNAVKADLFDANTVYVALDNHKRGDFKPYLYVSHNLGRTWKSITGDLPDNLIVWAIVQDDKNPELLFIATEFGVYYTYNGGQNWVKLNAGANIAFRDIKIQRKMHDLVAGSFGRGIFILDDYTPLRTFTPKLAEQNAHLFTPRNGWWYLPKNPFLKSKGDLGATYYTAPNPPFGVTFTYYLRQPFETLKQQRLEREKKLEQENKDIPFPGWQLLDKEFAQQKPQLLLYVLDQNNNIVKQIKAPNKKGLNRITWDLSFSSPSPITWNAAKKGEDYPGSSRFLVAPGQYKAVLVAIKDGQFQVLTDTVIFDVKPLYEPTLKGAAPAEVAKFWKQISQFQAKLTSANLDFAKLKKLDTLFMMAYQRTGKTDTGLASVLDNFHKQICALDNQIYGSRAKREIYERTNPTIFSRFMYVMSSVSGNTYGPTKQALEQFQLVQQEFKQFEQQLTALQLKADKIKQRLIQDGAPEIKM